MKNWYLTRLKTSSNLPSKLGKTGYSTTVHYIYIITMIWCIIITIWNNTIIEGRKNSFLHEIKMLTSDTLLLTGGNLANVESHPRSDFWKKYQGALRPFSYFDSTTFDGSTDSLNRPHSPLLSGLSSQEIKWVRSKNYSNYSNQPKIFFMSPIPTKI